MPRVRAKGFPDFRGLTRVCYAASGARAPVAKFCREILSGVRTTPNLRYLAALAAAALIGGGVVAGHGGGAWAQETICARSHTKVFKPETGKVECVEIGKSLQIGNQQIQKQRQRILQQRLRQDQLSRQVRARNTRREATVRQRQATQKQELLQRQRAAARRQKRLISEQRAILRDQRIQQRRLLAPR